MAWPPSLLDDAVTDARQAAPVVHSGDHSDERVALNEIITALGGLGLLDGYASVEERLAAVASATLLALGHSGVAYRPSRVPAVGGWFGTAGGGSAGTTPGATGSGRATLLLVPEDIWFDAYRYEVTTAGSSGTTARVFLMADNSGAPGVRHWYGAQTAADAVATVETVISPVSLPAGAYWPGLVQQAPSAPAVNAAFRGVPSQTGFPIFERTSTLATAILGYSFDIGSVAQLPPDTLPHTGLAVSGAIPQVIFRRCAAP